MAFDFSFKQLKGGFFDTDAVKKEVAKVERQTLLRFGAYVRRRIKSSLRYAKGASRPGRPPNVHTKSNFSRAKKDKKTGAVSKQAVSPLRELIFFAYDSARRSVVVGPAKFGGKGGIVPRLLEYGGSGSFRDPQSGQVKRGVWAPRPFVEPAAQTELVEGKYLTG